MKFPILIGLVAGECYNENDLYDGTTTNPSCEPWSQSEWAWPEMYSVHYRDGNYCRQRYPGEAPWCYGNYMNIGASSYHYCDIEKCSTPRNHVSPRRYPSYDATVAPYEVAPYTSGTLRAAYEDNDMAPETDFGFDQSFGGDDEPPGQGNYATQAVLYSAVPRTTKAFTTTTVTTTTTHMRTTRKTWSLQPAVKLDRGPRPDAVRNMKSNNAGKAPTRVLRISEQVSAAENEPTEVLEKLADDNESAVKYTAENSQGQLSVEIPKSVQSITMNIGTNSTTIMIMEIMVCSILVASFLVFSVLLCNGLRVNNSTTASRDVKKMPTELNAMRMKLDTLRDAFVNSSNLNTITGDNCIGINNTSFATEKPDV